MNRLHRFLRVPVYKQKLLIQSLVLVCLVRIILTIFPFRYLNSWASFFDLPIGNGSSLDRQVVKEVARSVRASSRCVPYATCLTQALATQTLLRIKGQNSHIRIGVDKDENDNLIAHAWVEVNGQIIIGRDARQRRFSILEPSDVMFL